MSIPRSSQTDLKNPLSLYAMALIRSTSPTLSRNLAALPPSEDDPAPDISVLI